MANSFNKATPTLVVSASSAYSANDVVGGLLTIDNSSGVWGTILNRIVLTDGDNQKAAMMLHLFDAAPTSILDNAPFTPSEADLNMKIAEVAIASADYTSYSSNARAQAIIEDINDTIAGGLASLYAYLVTSGTPTYTATTKLKLMLHFAPSGLR